MTEMLWKYRHAMSIGLVVIMHAVGLTSILLDPESPLLPLTPVNLWLCGSVAVLMHGLEARKDLIWMLAVYTLGFGIECVGVNTGWPFGTYTYLQNFGAQAWGTPWVIGMNWLLLALGSVTFLRRWTKHRMLLALGTGVVMVGIDALIEPLAPALRFWAFEQHPVPAANYVSWWVLGTIAGALLARTKPVSNPTSVVLLGLQVVFFLALLLFYIA